jgi:hypothetical protein
VKGWIEPDVVRIVEKKAQLNVYVSGARDHCGIECVTFRRDCVWVRNTEGVLEANPFGA